MHLHAAEDDEIWEDEQTQETGGKMAGYFLRNRHAQVPSSAKSVTPSGNVARSSKNKSVMHSLIKSWEKTGTNGCKSRSQLKDNAEIVYLTQDQNTHIQNQDAHILHPNSSTHVVVNNADTNFFLVDTRKADKTDKKGRKNKGKSTGDEQKIKKKKTKAQGTRSDNTLINENTVQITQDQPNCNEQVRQTDTNTLQANNNNDKGVQGFGDLAIPLTGVTGLNNETNNTPRLNADLTNNAAYKVFMKRHSQVTKAPTPAQVDNEVTATKHTLLSSNINNTTDQENLHSLTQNQPQHILVVQEWIT